MADDNTIRLREEARQRKQRTYEDRKAIAFSSGTKVLYVTCPLCGRSRVLTDNWGNTASFNVKEDFAIIQVRYGGGRGIGFFIKPDECLSISEVKEQYPEIYDNLKSSIQELAQIFV